MCSVADHPAQRRGQAAAMRWCNQSRGESKLWRVQRVLVVLEPGRNGAAALELARQVAYDEHAAVTIVGVAPRAMSGARCGNSAIDYNAAVADAVSSEIAQACEQLREASVDASGRLLVESTDDVLARFTEAGAFDLILLPARRRPLRASDHPAARRLRQIGGAEVRLVDSRAGR
jgi:hypothetical protein